MNNIKSVIGIACGNDSQGGSILIAIIAGMVLMGALSVGVFSFTSTDYMQGVDTKKGDSAYYLAESGLRYAAGQYKKIENEGANFNVNDRSADDEKADFLENTLDNQTLTVPDNKGTIDIDVYPYWFVIDERSGSYTLKLPGQVPKDFVMPTSGRLRFGNDTTDRIYKDYNSGVLSPTGVFSCSLKQDGGGGFVTMTSSDLKTLYDQQAKDVYTVLTPNINQTDTSALILPCTTPGMFPSRNGRILIETPDTSLDPDYNIYKNAKFDSDTNQLTLTGFSSPVTVTTDDEVILKKFIILTSQGNLGSGNSENSKIITNSIPIGDSLAESAPLDIKLDKVSDFNKYFDRPNNDGVWVGELITAGGAKSMFTNMKDLTTKNDAGEDNEYMQSTFTFKKGLLEDRWAKEHILDYDMQVKLSSYSILFYAAWGMEFRKQYVAKEGGVSLYQGFGISFMKYYSPAVTIQNGTTAAEDLEDGDTIHYYGQNEGGIDCNNGPLKELVTAEVDGTPVLTSGAGSIMLKKSSLDVLNDTCYAKATEIRNESGTKIADIVQVNHGTNAQTTAFSDYIPDSIKPPGLGSWISSTSFPPTHSGWTPSIDWDDMTNEGDKIAIVLWQQKVEAKVEYRRMLAYKEITHDIYAKGKHSTYDGRIVSDETCLLLRIREDYIDTTKVNKINIFYGDANTNNLSARTKNKYKYDIINDRMAYYSGFKRPDQTEPTGGWNALWPPRNLVYWTTNFDQFDYFSHIEKPDPSDIPSGSSITDPDEAQWDYIASTTGEIESWDGTGNAIFTLDDNGTITISDFTTPDSGTYEVCEIGLAGFFNSASNRQAGFNDFSIRVLDPGYAYGAFISSVQN